MTGARRVVAIVQARMGSARLPGKVLMELGRQPIVLRVLRNARRARGVAEVVLATSDGEVDDPLAALAGEHGIRCFRGSEHDVLDRFHGAAREAGAEVVVRLTSDNPWVDGGFIDECIAAYERAPAGIAYLDTSTSHTFPVGLSVEIMSWDALSCAWREDGAPESREHVTPYVRRQSERFPALHLAQPRDDSDLRWTIDTPEDLEMARALCVSLGPRCAGAPPYRELIAHLRAHPEIARINAGIEQRSF